MSVDAVATSNAGWFSRLSLFQRLALLAAVPLLLLAIAALINANREYHDVEREALEQASALARQAAARLDEHYDELDQFLTAVAEAARATLTRGADGDPSLARMIHATPQHVTGLSILSLDGRMLASTTTAPEIRVTLNVADRSYFKQALATRRLVVDEPVRSRTSDLWVSIAGRPVLDETGRAIGVVSMSVRLDRIQSILVPTGLPLGALMTVFNERGLGIASTAEPRAALGRDFSAVETVRRVLRERVLTEKTVASDGHMRFVSYAAGEKLPWLVEVGLDRELTLAPARAQLQHRLGLLALALALGLAAAAWLARGIGRPIRALGQTAERLSGGDLSARAPAEGYPEARRLAAALNHSVDTIESKQRELQVSEGRFRSLMFLSSDWYWTQDTEYRFTSHSDGRFGEIGLKSEDFFGKTRWDMPGATPVGATWEAHRALLDARKLWRDFIVRYFDRHGKEQYISSGGEPVFDENGAFAGYRGVSRLVTERFQLEAQRAAAQAALRESEAKFRALTVLSSDWYWEQDADFRFTSVGSDDPNWARPMIGKTRWELDGEPLTGTWADHQALLERHETFRDVEFRYTGAHGAIAYLSVSGEPVYDASGSFAGYRGTASDVTDRYHLQVALAEGEAKFRVLTELSSDWYWEQDEQYRFTSYSTQFLDSNQQPLTLLGKTRWELDAEPVGETWEAHRTCLERRETFRGKLFRHRARDGAVRYILSSGAPVFDKTGTFCGYRGTSTEVTERVRLEQELQERIELLRVTLDTAPVAIGVVRTRDNVALLANRAAHELLRVDPAKQEWSVVEFWGRREDAREVKRQLERGGTVRDLEMPLRVPGRDNVWALVSAQPARYRGEEVTVTTLNDITARKVLEMESRALQLQRETLLRTLRGANERLRLLSRQVLDAQEAERRQIAHELHDEIGQNLTALKLFAGHLHGRLSPETKPEVEEWISLLNRAIEQVRDLSRLLRPVQLDHMGLAPALRGLLDTQARAAGWTVDFVADADLPRIDIRQETVAYRVVQEALSNAARHADAASVSLEVKLANGELKLTLADDGRGFDLEAARKRVAEGRSMGLLGMEERVRLAGGTFHIESAPTQGTRIMVAMPIASEAVQA